MAAGKTGWCRLGGSDVVHWRKYKESGIARMGDKGGTLKPGSWSETGRGMFAE